MYVPLSRSVVIHTCCGSILCLFSLVAACAGAPLPRCIIPPIAIVVSLFKHSYGKFSQDFISLLLLLISFGPYMELFELRQQAAAHSRSSHAYTLLWTDMTLFYMAAITLLPCFSLWWGVRPHHFLEVLAFKAPAAFFFSHESVVPPWALAHLTVLRALLLLVLASSVQVFFQMQRAAQAVLEVERAQDRYLGALAHTRSTPLDAMRAATAQLRELVPSAASDACAYHAHEVVNGMEAALELLDIQRRRAVDVSRLKRGELLQPNIQPVDVRVVVYSKLRRIVHSIHQTRSVKVVYRVSDEIAPAVHTDGLWILIVLYNFISNAFDATSSGQISVHVLLASGMMRVVVSDSGDSVFPDEMWKSTKALSSLSTTRLWMNHAHHLVGSLGGRMGLQPNASTGGSTFWADVPYEPASPPEARPCSYDGVFPSAGAVLFADYTPASFSSRRGARQMTLRCSR